MPGEYSCNLKEVHKCNETGTEVEVDAACTDEETCVCGAGFVDCGETCGETFTQCMNDCDGDSACTSECNESFSLCETECLALMGA